ncbi:hypothetical protein [Clostridium scatologenes]|uniref:Uncharacterized protein n=1 Tax=Clostridium scatologenes TaxID=1548 RepID=A0A0E3GRE1_CLOSL|nr:hypothetical protein [Clostridium scatologenes]AKA70161.1 hypothetical protein CSCA_3036 [Clostridium scatologenes]
MKNELNVKQSQRETGNKIKEELSKYLQGMKVNVSYTNLNFKYGKGYTFYIYHNKNNYDYKKININYVEEIEIMDYVLFILECLNKNGKNIVEHISTAEEKYIIEILENTGVHNIYVFDGYLCDTKSDNQIDLSCIDSLNYDRVESKIEIVVDDEEFLVDLVQEEIIWTNEPDYDRENSETIDNDFMYKLCDKWNKIKNIWGILLYSHEDECLKIKDNETGNINDLVGKDDINYVKFNPKENKIYIEYDEDEYGFTGFELSTIGIEY